MSGKVQKRIRSLVFCDQAQAARLSRVHLTPSGFVDHALVHELAGAVRGLEEAQAAGAPFQAVFVDWASAETADLVAWMRQALDPLPVVVALVGEGEEALAQGFTVLAARLPLQTVPMRQTLGNLEVQFRQPLPAQRPTRRGGQQHERRVLVVEDHKNIRHLIANVCLHELGYRDVATEADGAAGWAAIERALAEGRPFDVVVSDWTMPAMDGLALFERLRTTPATAATAFVLLTAHNSQEDVMKAIDAGIRHYVTKPFSTETLGEKIREALQTGEARAS